MHAQDDALMISDLDLWRAAQVMIKGYGDGAATEAASLDKLETL